MAHTAVAYFLYSLGILYREGVEALLVVVALAAGTREARGTGRTREIYGGALVAVMASVALAIVVNSLISDDANDTMEGLFQILAAATLFYVSSWLTAKNQSDRWLKFIKERIDSARESALPAVALGLTAFLAVMREGAETIVFFQALTAGATEAVERHAVMAGVAVASVALAITFVGLNRAASKIPMEKFFYATSIMLYGLAVVFVGQGIASFQEAGIIRASFIDNAPTLPALGIFPTVQSLGAQLALLLFAAGTMAAPRLQVRRVKEARALP